MPSETVISTPLPAGISQEALVASLHDHQMYIKTTCPQLISYNTVSAPQEQSSPDVGQPCVYEVTDKRPIGQTTYKLTLTNREDGIDSVVDGKAPTGAMIIRSVWRIRGDKLEETVEIDSNILMKKMIKGNVEKSHPDHHQKFLNQAARA